jgi:hypothetical protein
MLMRNSHSLGKFKLFSAFMQVVEVSESDMDLLRLVGMEVEQR